MNRETAFSKYAISKAMLTAEFMPANSLSCMRKLSAAVCVLAHMLALGIGLSVAACATTAKLPEFKPMLPAQTLITADEMMTDLLFIRRTLENVHPALIDRFTAQQEEIFKSAVRSLPNTMRVQDFWFLCSRIIASLGDAHTRMSFPIEAGWLPIQLNWLETDGIVVVNKTGPLEPGDRIIAIGGKKEPELLDACLSFIPAENVHLVRRLGGELVRLRAFHEYIGIVRSEEESIDVSVLQRIGTRVEIRLSYVTETTPMQKRPWIGRQILDRQRAMLFWLDVCENSDEYRAFLLSLFAEIKDRGVEHLIIDVRRNPGGDSRAIDGLISFIDTTEYTKYGGQIRFSSEAAAQRGYKRDKGIREFPPEIVTNKPADKELLFRGRIWVLTSSATFSSGNWFGVILSDNHLATIVGEPTGNAPSSYGDILRFQTPYSQYVFTVSHKYWQRPNASRDPCNTLRPDIEIHTTWQDVDSGRDAQVEGLFKLLESLNVD
jgi:C-terminal processing protease CtpA/Prc